MPTDQLRSAKAQLRRRIQAELARLSAAEIQHRSADITTAVQQTAAWHNAEIVLAFVSLPGEVATAALCRATLDSGKLLGLPRVTATGLVFQRVDSWPFTAVRSAYGIREPAPDTPQIDLHSRTRLLVITPGLAFDRHGGRLGRGGGYYDRLFNSLQPRPMWSSMAVGFQLQLVDEVPTGPTDRRVHAVVTEQQSLIIPDADASSQTAQTR